MRFTRLSRGRLGVIVVLMLFVSLLTPLAALAAPAQHNGGTTEWVQVYTVAPGDTLASIAASFGVTVQELMEANSLHNPNVIYVGQQLIIPESYSHGTGGPQCDSYYTVRPHDTLSGIALYYGIDEYALAQANGIYDINDIYVGQSLCIPASGGNEYYPQPQQPQEYPQQYPQQNSQNNSQNDGCGSCGQSQNDGPHNEGDQQNGPQQEGPQQAGSQCDSCSQHNDSPQDNGSQNNNQQNSGQQNSGQQNNGQQNNGQQNNGQQNNSQQNNNQQNNGPQNDGNGCDPCGPQQNDGPHNDGNQYHEDNDHHDDYHDDGHHGQPLQPTDFWKANYYNDKYFGEFFTERQDLDVNFNWGTGAPIEGMNKDRFSVRWEKVANFKGGKTRFHAVADDGVRVYVDDQLIIDHWVIQPATEFSADVNLSDGPHKIVVEYYEEAEDAQIRVYWENVENYGHYDDYDHDDHDEHYGHNDHDDHD